MKFLLVFAVVLIGFYVWRSSREGRRAPPPASPGSAAAKPKAAIDMVQCAHCGVHLDAHDAILARSKYYCSAAHLEAGDSASAGR